MHGCHGHVCEYSSDWLVRVRVMCSDDKVLVRVGLYSVCEREREV